MHARSLLFGLVPLLGLAELALQQYFAQKAPNFAAYAALAPELLKLKQAGVPVVVAPAWAEPLVRQAAPAAFPLAELARPDDSGFDAFLQVSLMGQAAPELEGFAVDQTKKLGPFEVTLRKNPKPERVLFDFVAAVDAGEVEVFTETDEPGQRQSCSYTRHARFTTGGLHGHVAYPAQRFECDGARFVAVSVIDDQNYRARRCVLAQPPSSGHLVLRFSSVPASRKLVGFAGYSYFLARDLEVPQAELGVSEGAQPLGIQRPNGARGWSRFELLRSPTTGVVEVSLRRLTRTAPDLCFALEAR
jgi:hypothetical protein